VSTTDRELGVDRLDADDADDAFVDVVLDEDVADAGLGVDDDSMLPESADDVVPGEVLLDTSDVDASDVDVSGVDGSDVDTGAGTWLDEVESELEPTEVSPAVALAPDVLEELRHATVDGPIVAFAPQDDTSSAMRRPKRSPDFDPAPVPIAPPVPRILGRKPRVRRVTRVVRHVDPWSVFKIAAVASLVLYLVVLTAGVLLWNVAYATGTIDNVERFLESFGWSTFEFNGGEIYHNAWIGGLFVAVGLTGLAVLLATLFNLITDLVGGVRLTVLEEEVVESRTSPMRRFVIRRPEPEVPLVIARDDTGPTIREAIVDDSGAIDRPNR
jgi:hypothetical protein